MSRAYVGNSQVSIKIASIPVLKAYRGSNILYNPISVPDSPTNVSTTLSGKDAMVSFSAPSSDGGSPITNYIVQYSSNNGSSWNNFAPLVDPYFSNVALLLRMDGNNNSFVDLSPSPKTITAVGNVIQSSTESKWGDGKSAYFDGNTDRLTLADDESFYIGNKDYVVEAWLYIPSLNTLGGGYFFSQANNIGNNNNRQFAFAVNSTGLVAYWTTNGVSDQSVIFPVNPPVNQWFHVAFSRTSGILRAYLNGIQIGNNQSNDVTYFNSTADVCVGSFGKYAENGYGYLDFTGYIDDLRITVGSSRGYYGSTITVPSENLTGTGLITSSPVIINTLSYSKSYVFRAIAVNNIGNSSPSTSSSSITTPPGIVGNLYGKYTSIPSDAQMTNGDLLSLPMSSPSLYSSIDYGDIGDNYGFIAIGYFVPPTNGTYIFYTSSDDGSAVWIGSIAEAISGRNLTNAIVNNNSAGWQGDTERSGSISLLAGTTYAIRIIHREGEEGSNLRFNWAGPNISKRTSLATYFYASNFGSEPPEILAVRSEVLDSRIDLYITTVSVPATYYTIYYSLDNGNNYSLFGNGQTSPASPITISGLTNGTSYKLKIIAVNSIGSSEEYVIDNMIPSGSNIRPLNMGQAFLSNIHTDTVAENEFDNIRMGQAFLSNIHTDTVAENEFDNIRMGQVFLSNIYSDPI